MTSVVLCDLSFPSLSICYIYLFCVLLLTKYFGCLCDKSLIIEHQFTVYRLFDFVYSVCLCTLLGAHASTMAQGTWGNGWAVQGAVTALEVFHAAYKCHYNAIFKEQHVSWMVDEWHMNCMVSTAVDVYHEALPSRNTVHLAQQPRK